MRSLVPLTIAGILVVATISVSAQQPKPAPLSPRETHAFTIDGATLTISYGRPSMRGRKIFDGLRRYGVLWMPGADEATRIDTTADLRFGDVTVPKGSYTIYVIPNESKWTLIVNKELGQFHTVYHQKQDLVRVDMKVDQIPNPVEQLTITAAPRAGSGGGVFAIEWETTRASVPIAAAR